MNIILFLLVYLAIGYFLTIIARVVQKKLECGVREDAALNMLSVFGWPVFITILILFFVTEGVSFIFGKFSDVIEIISDKIAGK